MKQITRGEVCCQLADSVLDVLENEVDPGSVGAVLDDEGILSVLLVAYKRRREVQQTLWMVLTFLAVSLYDPDALYLSTL